jgi:vancomycin resistance protein VanJ
VGEAPRIRIVTWNVDGNAVSAEQLSGLLAEFRPEIVLLQECRAQVMATAAAEWHRHEHSGMCLLSRLPVRSSADRDRRDVWKKAGSGAIVRYVIEAPFGLFEVTNVHLETPREGFEDFLGGALRTGIKTLTAKNEQRYEEAALAEAWTRAGSSPARIVAGDFNTPPQSDLLRNNWQGYTNCFGFAGFGFGHTKHTRTIGVRIDHVLASSAWRCRDAMVVTSAGGSDHSPVMVELEWVGTPRR